MEEPAHVAGFFHFPASRNLRRGVIISSDMRNTLVSRFSGTVCLLAICTLSAFAADITGKWTADVPGREGATQKNTFDLKADGAMLTGTVSTPRGETAISDGKIDGDNISFNVKMSMGGNEIKMIYAGKVEAGELKMTREREGGQGRKQEFVAKRAAS